jgi:DNA repair protein RadC
MKQYDLIELLQEDTFNTKHESCLNEKEQDYIIYQALSILDSRHELGKKITSPEDTKKYLQLLLAERKAEVFGMLFLNNQHGILAFEELFFGTIDGASVYPRVIAQRALELNAAAVIAVHNHPSGISEPSTADKHITAKIKDALSLLDIRLLDHFIVSTHGTYSFAEHGLI